MKGRWIRQEVEMDRWKMEGGKEEKEKEYK